MPWTFENFGAEVLVDYKATPLTNSIFSNFGQFRVLVFFVFSIKDVEKEKIENYDILCTIFEEM